MDYDQLLAGLHRTRQAVQTAELQAHIETLTQTVERLQTELDAVRAERDLWERLYQNG